MVEQGGSELNRLSKAAVTGFRKQYITGLDKVQHIRFRGNRYMVFSHFIRMLGNNNSWK